MHLNANMSEFEDERHLLAARATGAAESGERLDVFQGRKDGGSMRRDVNGSTQDVAAAKPRLQGSSVHLSISQAVVLSSAAY